MVGTLDRIFFHTQYCFQSSLLQPAWCSGQTNSSRGNLFTRSLAIRSPCQVLAQWWKEPLKPGLSKGNVENCLSQLWNKNQILGNNKLVGGSLRQANMRSSIWITSIQIKTRQAWQPTCNASAWERDTKNPQGSLLVRLGKSACARLMWQNLPS